MPDQRRLRLNERSHLVHTERLSSFLKSKEFPLYQLPSTRYLFVYQIVYHMGVTSEYNTARFFKVLRYFGIHAGFDAAGFEVTGGGVSATGCTDGFVAARVILHRMFGFPAELHFGHRSP